MQLNCAACDFPPGFDMPTGLVHVGCFCSTAGKWIPHQCGDSSLKICAGLLSMAFLWEHAAVDSKM